jgi:dihydroxyacetone kinase-like predicted kinase
VTVVRTDSIPAGLAAMVSFLPERSAADNAAEMSDVLDGVVTGEVTLASRDVDLNGFSVREGRWLGLANGEPVAVGEAFDEVAEQVAEKLLAEPRLLMTLLTGDDAPELDGLVEGLRERHPELELEVQAGGQPHYPLLLSAE